MSKEQRCAHCGEPLRHGRRYCSCTCAAAARQRTIKTVEATCSACGRIYQARPWEQRRGGRLRCPACRPPRTHGGRSGSGLVLECYHCGAPCYRPRWRYERSLYTFCSVACRKAGWGSLQGAHRALR